MNTIAGNSDAKDMIRKLTILRVDEASLEELELAVHLKRMEAGKAVIDRINAIVLELRELNTKRTSLRLEHESLRFDGDLCPNKGNHGTEGSGCAYCKGLV